MIVYAGIGSRSTPLEVQEEIKNTASLIADSTHSTCRTGAAKGADQAFMKGSGHRTVVYLPWSSYEQEFVDNSYATIGRSHPSDAAIELARTIHPNWYSLSRGARLLHGRNAHIILGNKLDTPVNFVLCWAKKSGQGESGGTGLGTRLARMYNIPVINMIEPDWKDRLHQLIHSLTLLESDRLLTHGAKTSVSQENLESLNQTSPL